jgi:hypothetical protein
MRNGIYTFYNGFHLEVNTIRDDDRIILNYNDENCPFDYFIKSDQSENCYYLIIDLKELKNAYYVKTFGIFNGFSFQIFNVKYTSENIIRIGTNERDKFVLATGLNEIGKDWYIYDIRISELTKIWEERTAYFGLQMPDGLNDIEEIEKYKI